MIDIMTIEVASVMAKASKNSKSTYIRVAKLNDNPMTWFINDTESSMFLKFREITSPFMIDELHDKNVLIKYIIYAIKIDEFEFAKLIYDNVVSGSVIDTIFLNIIAYMQRRHRGTIIDHVDASERHAPHIRPIVVY